MPVAEKKSYGLLRINNPRSLMYLGVPIDE